MYGFTSSATSLIRGLGFAQYLTWLMIKQSIFYYYFEVQALIAYWPTRKFEMDYLDLIMFWLSLPKSAARPIAFRETQDLCVNSAQLS